MAEFTATDDNGNLYTIYVAFHAVKKLRAYNHTDHGRCTEICYLDGTTDVVVEPPSFVARKLRKA